MPKGQITPLKSKKSMSIFRHMTSGKIFASFLTLHFRRMPLLFTQTPILFYGYDKLNTIYLCGHVFDLYIENV